MPKALLGLILLAFLSGTASAQDDRYFNSSKSYAAVKMKPVKHAAYKRPVVHRSAYKVTHAPPRAATRRHKTIWQGFRAEVGRAVQISSRPVGCPSRAWCGCYLSKYLGLNRRDLWLARNWAGVGRAAHGPQVGAIVVWRHHVGRITAVERGRIRVLSGNDGRVVKDRWRTARGVIAYRML